MRVSTILTMIPSSRTTSAWLRPIGHVRGQGQTAAKSGIAQGLAAIENGGHDAPGGGRTNVPPRHTLRGRGPHPLGPLSISSSFARAR